VADHLDDNLRLLSSHHPELSARLDAAEDTGVTAKLMDTSSGYPTLLVRTEQGNEDYLHSCYNPLYEAKDLVTFTTFKRVPRILVFYGLGLGYHLLEYFKRPHPENSYLIVIEKEPAIFRAALRVNDLRPLLTHPRVTFLVGEPLERLAPRFIDYFLKDGLYYYGDCIEHLNLEPAVNLFPTYYIEVSRILRDALDNVILGIGNSAEDAFIGIGNIIANRREICASAQLSCLSGAFRGLPGIVLASGPSLALSLDLLRELVPKALSVACDSALDLLLGHGVVPNFVSTIERVPLVRKFFEHHRAPSSLLTLTIPVLLPEILAMTPQPRVMAFQANSSFAWLPIPHERQFLGPSCATLAFQALRLAGCDPIYLFGQDFAYDQTSGATHASGIDYQLNLPLAEERRDKVLEIPGNSGSPIPTTLIWDFMRRVLEYMIQKGGPTVYNAIPNTHGAAIHGTVRLDPAVAATHFSALPKLDTAAPLQQLAAPATPEQQADNLTAFEEFLTAFRKALLERIEHAEQALRFIERTRTPQKFVFLDRGTERKLLLEQLQALQKEALGTTSATQAIVLDLFHRTHLELMAPYFKISLAEPGAVERKLDLLGTWFETFRATCKRCLQLVEGEEEP